MNYYDNIKELLINNEITKKVKDYSKNKSDLNTYYNVGKLIVEAQGGEERAKYGNSLIKKYSIKLQKEIGKKYDISILKRMRQFYLIVQKGAPMAHQLTWSHFQELLPLKNVNEVNYYIELCIIQHLSKRELREKIKNKEYERLPEETKIKLINNEKVDIKELVPNPIVINNKMNLEIVTEKVLHQIILEDIELFMKELGNSFCFIGSEYKIKIGDRYNYIDFLLFNIDFNCYVVVEIKITEFKVEYIAQVQKYMNYIDKNLKRYSNNNTMGIIICKKENKFVIEYCSDDRIVIRKYELV